MPDHSHLDQRYFIDPYKYNCPFCNRRHVSYGISSTHDFDWTDAKRCEVIFVKCRSCGNESMHLTFLSMVEYVAHSLQFKGGVDIDDAIFFSVPTSFHVIDTRIPRVLRELVAEAEGCLKSNFLTGASACARKIVYEMAQLLGAEGVHYEERVKSLKGKLPAVDPTYFDTLVTVQEVTSSKVHEDAYDGWEANHLKLILASLREVLHEVYVVPAERKAKREAILGVKAAVLGGKKPEVDDDGGA